MAAVKKSTAAQLDREIAEVLARPSKRPKKKKSPPKNELFYLSEDQQGGRHADHIERFDNLGDALDTLAKFPAGSITYGTAAEGPTVMIVWAAPTHTDSLYWTDDDLNAQPAAQAITRDVRRRHAGKYAGLTYFGKRFRQRIADLKKRDYKWA